VTGATRTTLRRRLAETFVALAVLIAVLVTTAVVLSVRLYSAQTTVVDRLFTAYTAASDLNVALLNQETGFRGFALTGRDDYLAPYTEGLRAAERLQPRLLAAEGEYPSLRKARLHVQGAVSQWRTGVVLPGIARVRAGERPTPTGLQAGKDRFDAVRAAVRDYRSLIVTQRHARVKELRLDVVLLFGVLGAGLVLLLVSAVLAWVALRRWVTRPLQRLGTEVDRVEGGDLSRQVAVTGAPEEIAVLAEQIDGMRSRILHEYALAEASRLEALDARALIEEQAEDLRRSNTELEQFAYVASHDLQEPLRKVASFCQLIERRYKGQLDERGEQYIEFAVDGAKRMQQLINDLLMFSRVGRRSTGFDEVDLEQVLAQALRQLEATISEAGAEVTHDPLPRVEGDQSLLAQLFQNLVGNGVKFRTEAPPRVHLSASRTTGEGDVAWWAFTCADNGIGIEPEYADKIFVIFQRLHGREVYAGTGIGLAMCKKIVEYHGGRLWLDTTPRDTPGAVFRWTLPERQPANADRPAGGSETTDETDHPDGTVDTDHSADPDDATMTTAPEDRGRTADDATV
jgi:signal transduction histidine kinase